MHPIEAVENKRRHEQARLDLAMGTELRNRLGQFSTPSSLADDIVRYCWEHWKRHPGPVRFLEPCVGTGCFFSSLRRIFPTDLIAQASGCELDAGHIQVARALWEEVGLQVKHADFLDETPPATQYNLLITNPPYVRHHHLDPERKEQLQAFVRSRLHLRISGLAGLYCYFLLLADAWLADGALAVWLIPSEFMDVNYGTAVKHYLTQRVHLLHIHCFCPEDVQFDDALVSSAIVIYEKSPPADQNITFSFGGSLRSPARKATLPHVALSPVQKWSKYIDGAGRNGGEPQPSVRFGDLFTIKRGLATGNNRFFIMPRDRAQQLAIPDHFLRPILPSPRYIREPIIESDEAGYPKLTPQLTLIDCRLSEENVAKAFPRFWEYLLSGKAKGAHLTYLTSRRSPWYSQEDRPPPPYLCTYMGRTANGRKPFRFLWNKSQATAHNVYLLLYPRGMLRAALNPRPELHQPLFEALQSLDTDLIKSDGRVYGGGLFKMEPKELARIPAGFLIEALGIEAQSAVPAKQPGLFDHFHYSHSMQ
jgi:adenine-specific DNA-methyltransferase